MYQGNRHIFQKLLGIQQMLMAGHSSGETTSSATKGRDREDFIHKFLENLLPPQFRFGSGDITDLSGRRSGQVDIVVEYPLLPSLQTPNSSSRLYLAEGVAAVIEVKSDLTNQWSEVESTSRQLRPLSRKFGARDGIPPLHIPLFAVGYKGWKKIQKMQKYLSKGVVDGILVIDDGGLFVWNSSILPVVQFTGPVTGEWSLWAFIIALHQMAVSLQSTSLDLSLYARPDLVILQKICKAANNDESVCVPVFEITDQEGIEREEAKEMLTFLQNEKLVKFVNKEMDGIVTITSNAIEETKNMLTVF